MLSDQEIIDIYDIDEDDIGMMELVRLLLSIQSFENITDYDSVEKLEAIQHQFWLKETWILNGNSSDKLCRLYDDAHYSFRQMKAIVMANLRTAERGLEEAAASVEPQVVVEERLPSEWAELMDSFNWPLTRGDVLMDNPVPKLLKAIETYKIGQRNKQGYSYLH